MTDFHRIKRLPPYVFEQVNRIKAAARASGADIIDLGMGNPDLPTPAAHHRQAGRDRRQAAHRPLFGLQGHRRPAPGPGRLLRPPLRREAQPRHAGRRDARLQGGLRQHGAGDHRAGRRGAGAEPELSDPRLRLPDGRRRHPLGAGRADAGLLPGARAGGGALDPEAARARRLLSVEPDGLRRRRSISTGTSSPSRRSTSSSSCPTSPMPRSISTTIRRPRCCRCRAPSTSRSSSPRMSKTFSMAGWRMGFAVGNERLIAALARVKSYLDYGAFTPIQVAATAALNGPEDCIDEMRAIYKRRRDVLVESLRAGRLGRSRRRPPRCSPGRRSRRRSAPLGSARVLQAAGREGRRRGRAGHRLRRARRRLRAHRAGRERAAHPPGRAQHPPLLRHRRQDAAQRRADREGRVGAKPRLPAAASFRRRRKTLRPPARPAAPGRRPCGRHRPASAGAPRR